MSNDAIREETLRIFADGGSASDGGDPQIDAEIQLLCTQELLRRAEEKIADLKRDLDTKNYLVKYWYDQKTIQPAGTPINPMEPQ